QKHEAPPPADQRAPPEVVLEPHPRPGNPRPIDPPTPSPPRGLDLSDRPASGPLRTAIAERDQLVVGDIGTQLAAAAVDPLLQLGPVRVDHHRPARRLRTRRARLA